MNRLSVSRFGRTASAFLVLLVASVASSARAVEVDGIVATVGDVTILRSDVMNELRRTGWDESRFNEVRNHLVDRQLILKAAKDAKMTMQEWIVDNRVRELVDGMFGGDQNKLKAALAQQKLPYTEWRQRIKDDLVVGAMRWNMIDKNVSSSPAELKAEFARHPERYRVGRKVTVSVILLKPEDAEKRAEVSAALKDEDFGELAKRYSADTHAAAGGVWKDVQPEEVFRPEICEEIAKMPVGTLSRWVELDGWSFLLRKDAESGSSARTFAEAYDDIEANVRDANAKALYDAWMERLRAATYIKVY